MITGIVTLVQENSTDTKMNSNEPKNGFLVVTVRNDSNEVVQLHTQEGLICIQLQKRDNNKNRTSMRINAPRSIKITRETLNEATSNGG